MKKPSFLPVALFALAAVAGSFVIGSGVFAQSVTPVSCSPATVSVPVGQSVTLSAAGGDGTNYLWSSPGLVITNPTGAGFTVAFNAMGTYPVTVASAGTSSTCNVVVTQATVTVPPGLPNTGELPE
jgi:hypothetical protein